MNDTCSLADQECIPCRGGVSPLRGEALQSFQRQLPDWKVVNEHHLYRAFKFPNFMTALAMVNRMGELAEKVGHHPDLRLSWGKVEVEIWTHKIDGLSESDFVLAAKIDRLFRES